MRKVGLNEKIKFFEEMKIKVHTAEGIDAVAKQNIENHLQTNLFNDFKTDEDLNKLKEEVETMIKNSTKKVVEKVSENLEEPKKSNISEINNINTLNRDSGTKITSFQMNDGSIYVKDSSYSGDIKQVVEEVIKANPNTTQSELENVAFREMQRRQIDVKITGINNSSYNEKTKDQISKLPGDNKQVSRQYGIAVDNDNKIMDLQNMEYGNSYESSDEKAQEKTLQEKPKVKVYTNNRSAAFIDAALVGCVTLYTGVLGLCAIFSQM